MFPSSLVCADICLKYSSGGVGERGEPEVNNLMYTKRRKHIYAIRKHETTSPSSLFLLLVFLVIFHTMLSLHFSSSVEIFDIDKLKWAKT